MVPLPIPHSYLNHSQEFDTEKIETVDTIQTRR